MSFQIFDASKAEDRAEWIALWEAWPSREVFAHPAYAELFNSAGTKVCCASLTRNGTYVLHPFILRELGREAYCPDALRSCKDLISPYGYGGPFCRKDSEGEADWSGLADVFWAAFANWCTQEMVVTEFIRFALSPCQQLPFHEQRVQLQDNIVCDLRQSADQEWKGFDHKVRKNVKKAQRADLTVEIDPLGARLNDFLKIYLQTMDRRLAGEAYYFDRIFFESMHANLPGQFMYFYTQLDELVLSAELVLVSTENVYSFLGGTDEGAFEHRPNDLLKYEVMQWARGLGKANFVLGGGYQPDDGIFRYKRGFSPQGVVPFEVAQRILDPKTYALLIDAKRDFAKNIAWKPKESYFPVYRA